MEISLFLYLTYKTIKMKKKSYFKMSPSFCYFSQSARQFHNSSRFLIKSTSQVIRNIDNQLISEEDNVAEKRADAETDTQRLYLRHEQADIQRQMDLLEVIQDKVQNNRGNGIKASGIIEDCQRNTEVANGMTRYTYQDALGKLKDKALAEERAHDYNRYYESDDDAFVRPALPAHIANNPVAPAPAPAPAPAAAPAPVPTPAATLVPSSTSAASAPSSASSSLASVPSSTSNPLNNSVTSLTNPANPLDTSATSLIDKEGVMEAISDTSQDMFIPYLPVLTFIIRFLLILHRVNKIRGWY